MKRILFLICFFPFVTQAQQKLSLRECVELLTKNNLTYKQGNLQAESANAQLHQTKSLILPQIYISANNSLNIGRSIDQYTNEYIDQVFHYSSFGAGMSVPVYQGGKLQNQIRQNILLKESAMENRTAVLNTQTILLMQGYVNVLATKALYEAARQQVESSEVQVNRVDKQVNAGVLGNNTLYEIKAQLANDKFDQVTALNNYRTARLALFQRINIPADDSLELEALLPVDNVQESLTASVLYDQAQKTFPEAKSADLYYKSFAYQVKSIKALNYPSLILGANIGAFFASTNSNLDYFNQLNATRNGSVNLGLNIPIMGRWVTRPRVELAKVQERLAQNQQDVTQQILRQSIEQAVLDMNAAADKHSAAQGQVESLTASFAVVESKLNAGTANIFEYSLAKANLAKAQANAIQAKYQFLMQQRLLQYYRQGNWEGIF
ncbi:TolC family protein [Dyadobacter sp. NIV53]|uniref:TolC family protein n=1 Tax=Dyadobacter sp. NIV53 TaxID=2861765 RepID=UPI001C87E45B|nr:TolC family protein [Dyadobacter sp. NIV53]